MAEQAVYEVPVTGTNEASKAQQVLFEIACKRVYGLAHDLEAPIVQIIKALQDMRATGMEGCLLAAIINSLIVDEFTTTESERKQMYALIDLLVNYLAGDFTKVLPDGD